MRHSQKISFSSPLYSTTGADSMWVTRVRSSCYSRETLKLTDGTEITSWKTSQGINLHQALSVPRNLTVYGQN